MHNCVRINFGLIKHLQTYEKNVIIRKNTPAVDTLRLNAPDMAACIV